MAAAASSSPPPPRHLLRAVTLLLAVATLVVVAAGGRPVAGKGGTTEVVTLVELDGWGSTAWKNPKRAEMLGEHKKAANSKAAGGTAAASPAVLELRRHHSLTTVPDEPAARERYLRRLLAADEARAASLQPRNNRASTQQSSSAGASVPLSSGIRFQTLNYVTTIKLGGGGTAVEQTVIVDTGSDLTWVQCKPCSSCYAQRDPLFDPAGSATYAAVPCNASACAASLKAATGAPGSCATTSTGGTGNSSSETTAKCYYALAYGDGSFSRGVLATDTVDLGGARLEGFVFGCGLSNRGLFGGTAGLMGLGRTALSLVSQTASTYGGAFSYCLPAATSSSASGSSSVGSLSLGVDASSYRNTTPVAYTRMIADPAQPPFYFLNVTGAAVGGTALSGAGLFGAANVLVDSGTVITRLAPSAYRAVRAEFARQFEAAGHRRAPEGFSILDTCYDLTGHDQVEVPLLTLELEGGARVTVDPAGMLFVVKKDGSLVCLAVAGLAYEDQTPIIGNYQQKNKRVVYDTVAARIGFANEDCSYNVG